MSESSTLLRRGGVSRARTAAVDEPFQRRSLLADELPVLLEVCVFVLLISNTVYSFLELNTSSALPIKTWLGLLATQAGLLTLIISIRHAGYLRAYKLYTCIAQNNGVASAMRLDEAESLALSNKHHSERISGSWLYSLVSTALVLRLYIYVPQSQSALLDDGFDSSQLPTFPQLILGLAFVFEIIALGDYIGKSFSTFLQIFARYYYDYSLKKRP
jgi:hypothetical protein